MAPAGSWASSCRCWSCDRRPPEFRSAHRYLSYRNPFHLAAAPRPLRALAVQEAGIGEMLDRTTLSGEHDAVLALMEELMGCITAPTADQERIAHVRWQMTRVLLAHLAKEDALLYPKLKMARDPRVAAMAARMAAEVGDLATAYRAYITDWSIERIAREWDTFGADTRRIMQVLARRIEREETTLYPLIASQEAQRSAA